jgi:hypothetical protein
MKTIASYPPSRNTRQPRFDAVAITSDTLTGRGGLALFSRYLHNIGISPHLVRLFGGVRKSAKGHAVVSLFHQLFCFFLDGTSRHLVHFDRLKQDEGYAAAIETRFPDMASSHAVKRFLGAFSWPRIWLFRRLLLQLFVWRLKIERPAVVCLGIDAMVMDNDEAKSRHGVQPTYKRVLGFAPLQMTWGRFLIDAVFRGGKKHSNSGDTVANMVRHVVALVRKHYRHDVPIVLRLDSGFFDQKLFDLFEDLGIGYICTGKLYDDITIFAARVPVAGWSEFHGSDKVWRYFEFGDRRGSWDKSRRAFYTQPLTEDGQWLLEFARPDTVIYTNLGMGGEIDTLLEAAGLREWTGAEQVIRLHHSRGADELVHRALKEFGTETLPFKRFAPNAAYYYIMALAFFLYECFKEDVTEPVVPVVSYATTLRRKVIDFAAKIVRTGGQTVLKVTKATWNQLDIARLWERSQCPPVFTWA